MSDIFSRSPAAKSAGEGCSRTIPTCTMIRWSVVRIRFVELVFPSFGSRVVTGETKFGQIQVWPDQVWPRPSLAKTKFGQDQVWPDQVWPRPSLAKTKFGQDQVRDNQYSPCFCEGVAGRRPATPSHKHGLCPPFVSTGLHVEHRRPKAGNAPHEGLLKSKGGGFGVLGFRGLGFRV